MKDVVTVRSQGTKEKLPKLYLTMFLREAFDIFKKDNPEVEIGFSKFCSLRPKNVLLLKNTPADQCKCLIHENFILKLKALGLTYDNAFWEQILCNDSSNSKCWQNSCEHCTSAKKLPLPTDFSIKSNVKEWAKDSSGRLKLQTKELTIGSIYNQVIKNYTAFLKHVNIKRVQQTEFELDKNSSSKFLLQIDFAMSDSCEYQNEVQSALWSRQSVTLFTAASFFEQKCETFIVCSDHIKKDKNAIFVFLKILLEDIITKSNPSEYIFWSDGPSSEFKNRFMVKLLRIFSATYKKKFTWKYFATSHGKGVVDGVGGNIKRLVRVKSMSQGEGVIVQSAEDFANVAKDLQTKTKVLYVPACQISHIIETENPWACVEAVPGIKEMHVISANEDGKILYNKHALDSTHSVDLR